MPSSAVAAPARKAGQRSTPTYVPLPPQESANDRRVNGLLGLGQMGQGLCMMSQQWADAAAIGMHWDPLAHALADLADENEIIAKPIDILIEVGPYGALVTAAMPLVLQILANHKVIDATKLVGQNVVPPEVLESQMKARVARMQSEALREQQQAIAEADAARLEYERFVAESPSMNNKVPS
jgi:hypothetical protein